jgi:hypothetical protein
MEDIWGPQPYKRRRKQNVLESELNNHLLQESTFAKIVVSMSSFVLLGERTPIPQS